MASTSALLLMPTGFRVGALRAVGAKPLVDAITCTSRWPAAPPRVWGRSASSECSLLRRGAREEAPGGSG